MKERITNFIIKKMFIISKQPVLFRDLLEANALFNEGMMVDPAKLNFRFNTRALYGFYGVFCAVLLLIVIAILHGFLEKIDFHFSIIGAVLGTAAVFMGFDAFGLWARKEVSKRQILAAWQLHFPYFSYDKYSKKVEEIFDEAKKSEIPKKDLEKYLLERLVSLK